MAEPPDLSVAQTALLLRHLAGQTTAAEAEAVAGWLAADPGRARLLAMLEAAFEVRAGAEPAAEPAAEPSSADDVWTRLAGRLPAEKPAPHPLTLHRPASRAPAPAPAPMLVRAGRARPWLRAAAVLLLAGSGVALWQAATRVAGVRADRGTGQNYHEYSTRPSERALLHLPDGTQVTLGVASRLRVAEHYGRTSREVTLDGEAYFEVHHDPARRFLVHTAHGLTEDLGTRFGVRDYAGDTGAQVVVTEGRVALQASGGTTRAAPAVLTRGQLGRTTAAGTVAVQQNVDLDQYLAWLDGRLVLANAALSDALPQLSRWYDLDFRMGDSSLAALRLTATLRNQPIADALDLLAVILGVRVERDGRTVTLYPAPPQTP